MFRKHLRNFPIKEDRRLYLKIMLHIRLSLHKIEPIDSLIHSTQYDEVYEF